MDIKDSFGLKPVKENFSLNEKKDVPLYMRRSAYDNMKEIVSSPLTRGSKILNADKIMKNKSDYTQRGEK